MMSSRVFLAVSTLAAIAFLLVLASGLRSAPAPEATALARAVAAMAQETIACGCDIKGP